MKPYIIDKIGDFRDPFNHPPRTIFKYLCDECHKILCDIYAPGYIRLNQAQELLDGKGDEESI
jgi:hypothetical protein